MKCINFDSHFNQYVQRWMAENRSHYKNVDEMEAQMPDVYLKWINIPMDWLDGQTPALYFEQYDDPQMLCKWMLNTTAAAFPCQISFLSASRRWARKRSNRLWRSHLTANRATRRA